MLELSEIVRNFGLIIGGFIGLAFAGWRSHAAHQQSKAALKQNELAQRDYVAATFNRAIDQLGSDKLEVRLGAIYTLKQITREHGPEGYHSSVIEILTAYVRERTKDVTEEERAIDIQEITAFLRESWRIGES